MRLVWHIVTKDVRRMTLPLAIWIALVFTSALSLRLSAASGEVVLAGDSGRWLDGIRLLSELLAVMEMVVAGVLAAYLVQEDPLTGTEAAWLTRPIGGGRMLAAKLAGTALLLIVAPVLALTPIWLASGFSARELAWAAAEFAAWQLVIVVVAGSVAAITEDLGKFIFAMAGLALAFFFISNYRLTEWLTGGGETVLRETRAPLVIGLAGVFTLLVGGVQYFTRRTRLAWSLVTAGLALMLLVQLAWPWDLTAAFPSWSARWPVGTSADRLAPVHVEKLVVPADRNLPPATFLKMASTGVTGEFVVPWGGTGWLRGADRRYAKVKFSMGGLWGDDAAKRMLGLAPNDGPVTWGMATWLKAATDWPESGSEVELAGMMRFVRMRARVVGELPWRAGAQAKSGSSYIHILSVGLLPGSMQHGVMVEERDAWLAVDSGRNSGSQLRENDPARRDCYVLVNRALGIFKCLHIAEAGAMKRNSLLLGERVLEYDPPMRVVDGKRMEVPGWERDAVLVKVRFELMERWEAPIESKHVRLVAEEKKS
ncbi:MAG: hypothetical protein EXS37_02070 [Opitutus sp.]|nr:hypothetical protein [Opitutus sp.]